MFVHAAEAAHGDLGMITRDDVLLALSYSGEGDELLTILPVAKRAGTPLIAMTGSASSALARLADVHLDVHVEKEACPLNLARRPRPRRCSPSAMRSPSPASTREALGRKTLPAHIPPAPSAGSC